ncbi:MAG TPA: MBL fold metallo-hydrolase [Methylibium sp.]|nr:MBL fold metallo-hydrolase [Methylibium sp.]
MSLHRVVAVVTALLLAAAAAGAAELTPQRLAPGVYALIGSSDEAAPDNRGIVGNGGFIVGASGVIMVSTGSSYADGRARIALAERVAGKPVVLGIASQPLQEFVMGAAAFAERGIPVLAQDATAKMIVARCENCLKNLVTILGEPTMAGTQVLPPTLTVAATETREVAGRKLLLWHPAWAATPGDLLVLDVATGVAFAGALVSVRRIPELRDSQLAGWRKALAEMKALPIRRLVPGWGPVAGLEALAPMRRYFDDVERQATTLLESGASLLETAEHSDLPGYAGWALYPRAHARNLQQVYLRLEAAGVGAR